MTDSPAAAGRTTRNLRRVGAVAAALSGVLLSAIVATEVSAATHGSPGAHFSLYAGAILSAVLAASCLSFAYARRLMDRSDEKVDRLSEKIDDLIAVGQRRDYEAGLIAAELADLVDTVRQLVAESARWRAAERERAEVIEAMAMVTEKLGLRIDDLERVARRAMIAHGGKVLGDAKLIQMPSAETVRAARNLASRMIAAERRLHEDRPEDNQN